VVWLILNFVIVPATAWCWMMPDFPSPQLSTLPKVRDLTECFPQGLASMSPSDSRATTALVRCN
jgi:hypothetical protein